MLSPVAHLEEHACGFSVLQLLHPESLFQDACEDEMLDLVLESLQSKHDVDADQVLGAFDREVDDRVDDHDDGALNE